MMKETDKWSVIAQIVAAENLDKVNKNAQPVKVKKSFYVSYGKRIIDIVLSLGALVVFFPVNLIVGIITFFDVGSPILFKQTRTGKNGKKITIIKFRNMTNEKDKMGNLLPPNQRVTRFGIFVRKYSIDELLNFWSVLKGDMSIIGPRPLPHDFYDRFSNRHKMRYAVKPGLECPSLVKSSSVRLYHEQLENDIWYVENVSLWIDIKLFFRLIGMVLNKNERADHAVVTGGTFIGYDENGRAFSTRKVPLKYENKYEAFVLDRQKRDKTLYTHEVNINAGLIKG